MHASRYITAAAIAVVSALWVFERTESRALQAQLRAANSVRAQLTALRAEQETLGRERDDQAMRSALAAAETDHERRSAQEASAGPSLGLSAAAAGEWSDPASWRDCGVLTPRAALETALWAAAGGDIPRFAALLEIPANARAQAEALLARLPPAERERYPTAEALIAALMIKRVPVGPAQLVWARESDPDQATLAVFVRDPAVPRPPPTMPAGFVDPATVPTGFSASTPMTKEEAIALARARAEQAAVERARPGYVPPSRPPPHTRLAYVALQRGDAGWRLHVPLATVSVLASELGLVAAASGPAP